MSASVALETVPLQQPEEEVALLIARTQAGDRAAFAALYRANHRRIYALCVRLCGDRHLAEELTQEAFIRAWEQLHTYRAEARFSTWLHRVAVNVVLTWQRKHKPWLRRVGSEDELPETAVHETPDKTRDLEGAISRLPERARQVFVLMDIEGYRHEETAGLLGIAVGTSKAQLFRAREHLRGMLS